MINKIKKAYLEGLTKYPNKPNNYIPAYIRKTLGINHTNEELNKICINGYLENCIICGNDIKYSGFGHHKKTCSRVCSCQTEEYKQRHKEIHLGKTSALKGKTYAEIYGDKIPNCGFQSGEKNIAKRPDIRKKISEGVRKSYTEELREIRRQQAVSSKLFSSRNYSREVQDKFGNLFRSKLEVKFSELLINNNINYEYEKTVLMTNGKHKIVDFVIDNKIYIEITGFAYSAWQQDFISKLVYLKDTIQDDFLLLFTYNEKFEKLCKSLSEVKIGSNIFIGSIEDDERILKTIQFTRDLIQQTKEWKYVHNNR